MTPARRRELRRLEGSNVYLALADGTRRDDVMLVSAHGLTVWIFDAGEDLFLPAADVIDFWPGVRAGSSAA